MEKYRFDTDALIEHYINQVFKMLGLFESKDKNGHKHGKRIRKELANLPEQFPALYKEPKFNIVIAKIDEINNELTSLDGEHQDMKNQVFETINLLESIKGCLR